MVVIVASRLGLDCLPILLYGFQFSTIILQKKVVEIGLEQSSKDRRKAKCILRGLIMMKGAGQNTCLMAR
jgi:hypothetical protein